MAGKRIATRRPSIKIAPHEKRMLEELYLERGIPRDQYKERPQELIEMVDDFNRLTGRVDTPDEILRYIINRQKNKNWVVFNGNHLPAPEHEVLTADQTDVLVQIYTENVLVFGRASDALASDGEMRDLVSKEFGARTNRIIPGYRLAAILELMRKAGLLPLLGDVPEQELKLNEDGIGFSDIDQVDGQNRRSVGA